MTDIDAEGCPYCKPSSAEVFLDGWHSCPDCGPVLSKQLKDARATAEKLKALMLGQDELISRLQGQVRELEAEVEGCRRQVDALKASWNAVAEGATRKPSSSPRKRAGKSGS